SAGAVVARQAVAALPFRPERAADGGAVRPVRATAGALVAGGDRHGGGHPAGQAFVRRPGPQPVQPGHGCRGGGDPLLPARVHPMAAATRAGRRAAARPWRQPAGRAQRRPAAALALGQPGPGDAAGYGAQPGAAGPDPVGNPRALAVRRLRRPRLGMDCQLPCHRRPVPVVEAGDSLAGAGGDPGHGGPAEPALLGPGPGPAPLPAAARVLRRPGAGGLLHRHRPGDRLHHAARAAVLRRRRGRADPGDPALGRLPGWRRLRRAADELRGPLAGPAHPATHPRRGAAMSAGVRDALNAALRLGGIALVAVALLAGVHLLTREPIAGSERRAALQALELVMPAAQYDNDLLEDRVQVRAPAWLGLPSATVHRARLDGQPSGLVLDANAPDGYAGDIRLLIGVDAEGRVLGVRVTAHAETPGLGDRIETRRSDWIHDF